jgi:hypothetical protein
MTLRVRDLLLGTVACAATAVCVGMALVAPAAQAAAPFGVEKFVAANCKTGHENCVEEALVLPPPYPPVVYSLPKEPTKAEAEAGGYTQAAGHPAVGITAFKVNTEGNFPNAAPAGVATGGVVTHVRTDVAPGVSTNPEAVKKCTMAEFEGHEVASGVFTAPTCSAETEIGINKVVVWGGPEAFPKGGDFPVEGKVYNVVQPNGLASLFAVALDLTNVGHPGVFAHTLIEGHIEWAGDYHDYYEINVSPAIPLIASRLSLFGNKGNTGQGGFITNPSRCEGSGPLTTNEIKLKSVASQEDARTYIAPIGPEGCNGLPPFEPVPFAPSFSLTPETKQSDLPDGITTELVLPHDPSPANIDSSQLKTASITLPEGMTLNPSAAQGLQACTPAQARIHSLVAGVACPEKSEIGTVTLDVPDLPPGSLAGRLYLGGPESGPITGPPYTMYIDAESAQYGISVRLEGEVTPNETTGRVTATFAENPEQPFSNVVLHFKGGALAPIANPLVCGPAKTETSLVPYTGTAAQSPFSQFTVDSNNAGGACALPLPFALGQSTASTPATGGANTNFTFNLSRADGQQYLSRVSATLPPGLVGKIPAVPLCPEPQASLGTCSSTSQIGTATTTVGSGPTPIQFSGPVFLTGPTGNAPYGMTTVINAAVGPFSLGNVIVRTGIEVDPITARVTVAGDVPTIFKGIPLRMKTLSVAVNRQGFLINPTNCGALTVNTALTSTLGATQTLSSPFQATGCSSLAFKPKFSASSNGKTSRANGAALNTKISYPSGVQANIKSVLVTLPKQLPSRLSTLKNACREAVFNANPFSCPSNSRVGGATVKTPVLPEKLSGPAFFVSHGGAAFPDLDFVLTGNGVTVIMVGNTNISKGVTTSKFAAIPDVPVSSFEANLPVGQNSAVTANGSLCKQSLVMPTTITAQNGKVIKQNTPISVSGCPVTVISSHTRGNRAIVTVRAPAAGRVSGSGTSLRTVYRRPGKAEKVTLEVPLTSTRRPLAVRVRIGFIPTKKGASSITHTTVLFK